MFKRGGLYYYMTGSDCCFCQWGGDARVWTARNPLGPWHPGVAPVLPTRTCNVSGEWYSIGDAGSENITLLQSDTSSFIYRGRHSSAVGRLESDGYVVFRPAAGDGRGVITSADGKDQGCDRIRWYGYESFIWCRRGAQCSTPKASDATEVNMCADGREPQGVRVNPCAPNNVTGTNFTVPAQQFNVIEVPLATPAGAPSSKAVLFFGEISQSAADGLKSHNLQAWVPLEFTASGAILPMRFPQQFELDVAVRSALAADEELLV